MDVDARVPHKQALTRHLRAGGFRLPRIVAEHPNRGLGRGPNMEMLKGYERSPFDRSIDVRVTRLRRKIGDDPNAPQFIRTVWGEGYLFSPGDTV